MVLIKKTRTTEKRSKADTARDETELTRLEKLYPITDNKKLQLIRGSQWSQCEVQKLKELYPKAAVRQIAKELGRSCDSIQSKARLLGLNAKDRVLPRKDLSSAIVLAGAMENAESDGIITRVSRDDKRFNATLPWSEADAERLKKLYPVTANKKLAEMFGRSQWAIIGKARGLGLEKDYGRGYRRQCTNPVAWSDQEEQLLAALFPTTPREEIAELICRTLGAISNKAKKMGLRKIAFWTEAEDDLLKKLYKKLTYEQLAQRLDRSIGATKIRVIVLGLECKVDNWTEYEIDYLKKNYQQMTYQQIGQKIGRTWTAVAAKAEKTGLVKDHRWTDTDSRKLKQLHTKFTTQQIARILGCSYSSVRSKIRLLGLRKEVGVTKEDSCLISNAAVAVISGFVGAG